MRWEAKVSAGGKFGPSGILVGGDPRQPRESLSLGYEAGKFSPPDGLFDRDW